MIVIACAKCNLAIRVMPLLAANRQSVLEVQQLVGKDSDFWPDRFPCPGCGKNTRGMFEAQADTKALRLMRFRDLTPIEAFHAFSGLGFPEEQRCSLAVVEALLLAQPVRKVRGTDVMGTERTIVDALELQDGTIIHFGAGAEGACIYRIVRPPANAARALAEGEAV
jgi:hypothetical protein